MEVASEVKARLAKRCPCCGSENVLMDNPKWIKMNGLSVVTIKCGDCDMQVSGYAGHHWVENRDYTLEQAYVSALKRWNRRAA